MRTCCKIVCLNQIIEAGSEKVRKLEEGKRKVILTKRAARLRTERKKLLMCLLSSRWKD